MIIYFLYILFTVAVMFWAFMIFAVWVLTWH